jgi:excisionase family DNA binding protein
MSIHSTALGDDERLVVRPKVACQMLAIGVTRLYELLDTGELESYRDGSARKITVASIRTYVTRQLKRAAAEPASGRRKAPRARLADAELAGEGAAP